MLEIIDLAKRYGSVVALDGATFTARPGRIVGFLGPNGAGKTTTMRCVFGLARPDRGEVRWNGQPVDRLARLRFGYMPEQRGLYPRMRVGEQLSYFAQQHGLSGKDADAAAGRWLDRMGLADRAKSKLEELSHGNQQRVQLAVALAHDPELLVLDEPFSGLDPIGIATMTEVVQDRAAAGVGVVFSSHQLDLVEDVCEDVVIIARGRIVAAGAIDELKARSGRHHLEVEVVGSDGTWLDGDGAVTLLERSGDRVKLLVRDDIDLDALLSRAQAAGEVRTFAYQPPKLSELFMEAVTPAEPVTTLEAGAMSRLRSIWLVARREVIERGRSRGFVLSVFFTTALVVGSLVVPSILFGDEEATQIGVMTPAPTGLEAAIEAAADQFDDPVAIVPFTDAAAARSALEGGTIDALVTVPVDLSSAGTVGFAKEPDQAIGQIVSSAVIGLRMQQVVADSGIDPGDLVAAQQIPSIDSLDARRAKPMPLDSCSPTSAPCSSSSASSASASRSSRASSKRSRVGSSRSSSRPCRRATCSWARSSGSGSSGSSRWGSS